VSESGRNPTVVAAALLGDQRMVEACGTHDLQTMIRLMRSRGASLRGLASVTGMSPGRIYEYETGERHPQGFEVFERISDGLRIPGRHLRLADRPWEEADTIEASPDQDGLDRWVASRTVEAISLFTRRDLMLNRREATKAIATLAVGTPLIECAERWLIPEVERHARNLTGNIGTEEIERIEQAAHLFREWDDHFGGGLRRKAVVGQLNEVADLLHDSHPAEVTRRLFRVMAHLAETAAMMSWDSGMHATAQRYYILALRASKEAKEYVFGANILASMARQLLYMGRPDDALELIRLADDGAKGRAPGSVRSMLRTREAWAYAKLGRVQAFRRATGKAEEALAGAGRCDDPYWIRYFDEAELAGVTGGRLLELAQEHPGDLTFAREAEALIDRALKLRRPESMRSFSLDQAGLAQTYFLQRELEQAVSAGHKAIDLAEQTHSDRVRAQLADLYQLAVPHKHEPAVREFGDRLSATLCA
jgi:transcriptional regulator with XRE-family HTH domain/tetratricopeptide (TPR) repeat protein